MSKTIACIILLFSVFLFARPAAQAQLPASQAGRFLGTWCAQGDPSKRTSISTNGVFLTLTNEVGSTSIGRVNGLQITADEWQFVHGSLSADGKTITWTNGTFWTRCSNHRHINLTGTWYFGSDRSKPCRIEQHGSSLSLQNESGQTASGSFVGKYMISTVWSGVTITGTISRNHKQILWSNGTYWRR